MPESLFEEIKRVDAGPADYSEPHFPYLNRSARDHFLNVRTVLDCWYNELCELNPDSAADVRARFRSDDNEHHISALTELYLHHLLIEHGYHPHVHPKLEQTSSRPDFAAMRDGEIVFLLEAVLVYEAAKMARADRFQSNILDAIDAVNSPDFLISVDVERADPNTQPKTGAIRRFLQGKVDALDWEEVCRIYEETKEFPKWIWKQDEWEVEFSASPVTEEGRNRRSAESRVTGAIVSGAKLIRLDEAIRSNVLKKAGKYGKPECPLIVAVNVVRDSIFCDDELVMEALCGKETFTVTMHADGSQTTTPGRDLVGIWTDPQRGTINRHLSALLVLPGLTNAVIETVQPVLWHHPFAERQLSKDWQGISQRIFNENTRKMDIFVSSYGSSGPSEEADQIV